MAIDQFEVFRKAKKCMKNGNRAGSSNGFADVSNLSPLLISRADVIKAGIPKNWFIDSNYRKRDYGGNEIMDEQFNLRNLK